MKVMSNYVDQAHLNDDVQAGRDDNALIKSSAAADNVRACDNRDNASR